MKNQTLANINILFNGRNSALKFIENYSSMNFQAKRLTKQGGRLKILTPKKNSFKISNSSFPNKSKQ